MARSPRADSALCAFAIAGAPFICGAALCGVGLIVALTIRSDDVRRCELADGLQEPLLGEGRPPLKIWTRPSFAWPCRALLTSNSGSAWKLSALPCGVTVCWMLPFDLRCCTLKLLVPAASRA